MLWRFAAWCLVIAGFTPVFWGVDPTWAETYQIDPVHSSVDFSIRHLVSRSKGKFKDFSGVIVYDEKDMGKSFVQAVIKAASPAVEKK